MCILLLHVTQVLPHGLHSMWAVIIATHKEACSYTFMGLYLTHICKLMTHTKSHPLTHLRPCRRNACSLLLNVTVLCSHSDMHLCIHSKLIKGRHEQDIECHSLTMHLSPKQCCMCSSVSSSPLPDTPSLHALCPVSPSG